MSQIMARLTPRKFRILDLVSLLPRGLTVGSRLSSVHALQCSLNMCVESRLRRGKEQVIKNAMKIVLNNNAWWWVR